VGLALRYWIAFVVFLNQGFAWDMATFASWMDTIRFEGFNAFSVDPGINYPPVFTDILALLNWIGDATGISPYLLMKWPAVLADIGIGLVIAFAGRKWFGGTQALVGAAAYLLLPISWYDSAIWGQVDSLSMLPMLLSIVFLIDKKPEWSMVFFVLAVLTKPQGALILLILLPVLIGQVINGEIRLRRIGTSLAAGIFVFALVAVPWSLESYLAPYSPTLASIPVIGDLLGLAVQYISTAGMFPVLTANAFNIWAGVGNIPLAQQIQDGHVLWLTDEYPVFGIPAQAIGGVLFLSVVGIIFWMLIKRHSPNQVLLGSAALLVAFFALPTRVHERYLAQAFAILVLVWVASNRRRILLAVLAIANTLNLHAILAADLGVETVSATSAPSAAGVASVGGAFASNQVIALTGNPPEFYAIEWVRLDATFARAEWVVWSIIVIHSFAFMVIFADYLRANDKLHFARRQAFK
jgi:dolichyl-phosphate-mannose-protein mannosyltransferase